MRGCRSHRSLLRCILEFRSPGSDVSRKKDARQAVRDATISLQMSLDCPWWVIYPELRCRSITHPRTYQSLGCSHAHSSPLQPENITETDITSIGHHACSTGVAVRTVILTTSEYLTSGAFGDILRESHRRHHSMLSEFGQAIWSRWFGGTLFTDRVQCPFLTRFFTEIGRTNMCAIWRIAKIWECPFMPCRREPPSSGPQYHFPRRRWTQRSPSKPSEPSRRRPFSGKP